jgi:hypothetical protein
MQFGVWLTTLQSALMPHDPGHGSWHFRLMHARWLAHSPLLTHSGLQFGGDPVKAGRHEQDGLSPATWHAAFGPHGEGWHGFVGGASEGGAANKQNMCVFSLIMLLLSKFKKYDDFLLQMYE